MINIFDITSLLPLHFLLPASLTPHFILLEVGVVRMFHPVAHVLVPSRTSLSLLLVQLLEGTRWAQAAVAARHGRCKRRRPCGQVPWWK